MASEFDIGLYDYDLPREMIAQQPADRREDAPLLLLQRDGGLEDVGFRDLGEYVRQGDLLVMNDSRVIPARLFGERTSGGKIEVLLMRELGPGRWELLAKCNGKLRRGEFLSLAEGRLSLRLLRQTDFGGWHGSFRRGADVEKVLEEAGFVPLPPYIERCRGDREADALDRIRYQTVYARHKGSVAAPTAGLHFSQEVIEGLRSRGVGIAFVTLHVGLGTFRPVQTPDVRQHKMHAEYCEISEETAGRINETRGKGGRVVAVGTTSCRTLEFAAKEGCVRAVKGWNELFIYPPYDFKVVDALITNFHLPKSTLLLLVSAFASRERILEAYEHAKSKGYRFYSYGDAMLIL